MDNTNKSFFEIALNSDEKMVCSPDEKQPNWRGIVINAPRNISKNKFIFPICGFYRLSLTSMIDSEPLKILVHHIETNIEYTGFLVDKDDNPEAPIPFAEAPEEDASKDENMALGSYFNPNILDYVKMPFIAGVYRVAIEYGNEKSNVVLVSIND